MEENIFDIRVLATNGSTQRKLLRKNEQPVLNFDTLENVRQIPYSLKELLEMTMDKVWTKGLNRVPYGFIKGLFRLFSKDNLFVSKNRFTAK